MEIEFRAVEVCGLVFDLRLSGPEDGDPVMLLHGFPETSMMWEGLMADLAEAGYRCAAPNQRGYSSGARPDQLQAYAGTELVADVFAIADVLGWGRFHLVAHDWGAAVGWQTVQHDPSRIVSYSALSIPHYRAFAESSWEDADTEAYRHFLQLILRPDSSAEDRFARNDMAGFRATWFDDARTIKDYVDVLSQPGALRSVLAWYRASQGHRSILDHPPPRRNDHDADGAHMGSSRSLCPPRSHRTGGKIHGGAV